MIGQRQWYHLIRYLLVAAYLMSTYRRRLLSP